METVGASASAWQLPSGTAAPAGRLYESSPAPPHDFSHEMNKNVRDIEVEVVPDREPTRRSTLPAPEDPMIAFMSRLMDSVFSIPGTNIRFGLDPILGLLPGLGDTIATFVSVLLIAQSARYGVPKVVLARMALNAGLNASIGAIPVVGDAFSFWFKSNDKNYALLRRHAGTQRPASRKDWIFVIALIGALVLVLVLVIAGAATLLSKLFQALG